MYRLWCRLRGITRNLSYRNSRLHQLISGRFITGCFFASASCVESKPTRLRIPEPESLSVEQLIRSGTVQMVNAAAAVLNQTAAALLDVQQQYIDTLERLTGLLELCQKALGYAHREDHVWEAIMDVRSQLQQCQTRREELQFIFSCAEQSLESAGQAAQFAGSDYAGQSASEQLHLARTHLDQVNNRAEEARKTLLRTEQETMQVTAEYERKVKKKAKTEEKTIKEEAPLDEEQLTENKNLGE